MADIQSMSSKTVRQGKMRRMPITQSPRRGDSCQKKSGGRAERRRQTRLSNGRRGGNDRKGALGLTGPSREWFERVRRLRNDWARRVRAWALIGGHARNLQHALGQEPRHAAWTAKSTSPPLFLFLLFVAYFFVSPRQPDERARRLMVGTPTAIWASSGVQ